MAFGWSTGLFTSVWDNLENADFSSSNPCQNGSDDGPCRKPSDRDTDLERGHGIGEVLVVKASSTVYCLKTVETGGKLSSFLVTKRGLGIMSPLFAFNLTLRSKLTVTSSI